MQKVRAFYIHGVVVTTSPLNQVEVLGMKHRFQQDLDVVHIEVYDVEKEAAQADFRSNAEHWKRLGESVERSNRELYKIAHHYYIDTMRVGHSG